MDKLCVRVYNVQFGDAILISVPDKGQNGKVTLRHILIDVGNSGIGKGGADFVFEPVLRNIVSELGDRPLDLYVMTHEHMDHVQGLPYASEKLGINLNVDYAWLPVCSREGYYEEPSHGQAKEFRDQTQKVYAAIQNFLKSRPGYQTSWLEFLMATNDYAKTEKCVSFLRKLAQNIHYVYRGYSLGNAHPFEEAQFEIWAPEEDIGLYAKKLKPMAIEVAPTGPKEEGIQDETALPTPPAGVDAGAFYNLVQIRSSNFIDNLLVINSNVNNTSIVFSLDWRGWRLLFTGDAEQFSWQKMSENNILSPVDFLKVSHHGSQNGTPISNLLDQILSKSLLKKYKRRSVVSTFPGAHAGIPDRQMINKELMPRCQVKYVEPSEVKEGQWMDFEFPP